MTVNPLKWLKIRIQAKHLVSSGFFNPDWYLSRNPDVKKARVNPLEHYLKFGASEGRDPHPGFLSQWYSETYADSIKPGSNPLIHYILKGQGCGFKPHPALDSIENWETLREESVPGLKVNPALRPQLKVGFAVTDDVPETAAGDYFSAKELGAALHEAFGWEIRLLAKTNSQKSWFDVSGLDCLIVMLDDYDLQRIYGTSQNLITIAWVRNWFDRWVDRPWFGDYHIHLSTSQIARDFLKSAAGANAAILRLATNSKQFNRSIKRSSIYASDYCFTGSYWGSQREIEKLEPGQMDLEFGLYGSGWENHKRFKLHWRGAVQYNEINRVYASSKLVIDDANHATKKWGSVNSRVFDALATGTLVLTNGETGAYETFGDLLPTYHSAEDMKLKIKHFMNHTFERDLLIDKLHDIVHSQHTYDVRAQQLLNIIKKFIATQKENVET